MSRCPQCGAAVTDEMRFCANCGRALTSEAASGGGVVGMPTDLRAGRTPAEGGGPSGAEGGGVRRPPPAESTVSFAPAFEDEGGSVGEEEPGNGGAALIELDQVEGTAGRRMHDINGDKTITVGRGRGSDIFLDDVTVSRGHAEIFRGGGPNGRGFRIRDTGSLNGTYVNRVRVDSVDLRNGDEIQIGKYRFKFVFG